MIKVNEEKDKKIENAKERDFNNYVVFFWNRRNKETELKQKKKVSCDKLEEKKRILKELDDLNEERKTALVKKMKTMDMKRELYEKIKQDNLMKLKELRERRFLSCLTNRKHLSMIQSEKREEILNNQTMLLSRSLSRDTLLITKKSKAGEQTVNKQMTLEKNLAKFHKVMNSLKSQSILKLTQEEKFKIFREYQRKEAERKRKEEEEANK